jgi:hypothetical protein
MKIRLIITVAMTIAATWAAGTPMQEAYEAQAAGRQSEALQMFLQHLDTRPGDTAASLEAAEI